MVDKLTSTSITTVEELLCEDFHYNSSSSNSYFTNSEIPMEEQLSELPNLIIIK